MTDQNHADRLVERARSGNREAFDELAKKFEGRLRSFILSRVQEGYRNQIDAEEVLQDTFVRAHGSLHGFQGTSEEEFRRWLTGVANKTVLRAQDRARRHRTLAISSSVPAKGVSPSRALRRKDRFDRLQGAIDSLRGDYREVVFLTRIEGLSIKQAAEHMGRSPEATKKLFWRALKQLRQRMTNTASMHLPDQELDRGGDHEA